MKTSEKAKAAGLKNLNELSQMTGKPTQTLNNWDKNEPELFDIVLKGAAFHKFMEKMKI